MTVAFVSLLALLVAIVAGRISKIHVGIGALALAWVVGTFVAGMEVKEVLAGFPINLFVILFGVTLLFGQAMSNGTLSHLAQLAVRLADGNRAWLPIIFFVLALLLSAMGPGNIGAVALLAPIAMSIAAEAGISAFLMTIMVATGANAGGFSPFAPTGIIANGLIEQLSLTMDPWREVFLPTLVVQSAIAMSSYLLFGGVQLWWREMKTQSRPLGIIATNSHWLPKQTQARQLANSAHEAEAQPAWSHTQLLTLAAIALFIVGVTLFNFDAGPWALVLACLLTLTGSAEQEEVLHLVPWSSILLVCGVSTLVAMTSATGGLSLFITGLASVATPNNASGVLAFASGLLSVYSSSSGVVMPTFISLVPELIAKLGGGDPVTLVAAINIGSHMVDVSPLSTLGALCIAAAGANEDKNRLFQNLLLYGLAMAVIGAVICYAFLDVIF